MSKVEKRSFLGTVSLRKDGDKNTIDGVAATTESRTDLGMFFETIEADAFKDTDFSDVVARTEHDNKLILGRTLNDTLSLELREGKLHYKINDLPNTSAARDTKELIDGGYIRGSSFAFTVSDDNWEELEGGAMLRTIRSIDKVYDVSPVVNPAYQDTSVALRNMEEAQKEQTEEEKEETPKAEEKETPIDLKPDEEPAIKVVGLPLSMKIALEKARG